MQLAFAGVHGAGAALARAALPAEWGRVRRQAEQRVPAHTLPLAPDLSNVRC